VKVAELIDRFLAWHTRHNKPATVASYRKALRWLAAYADGDWTGLDRDGLVGALERANSRPDGTPWRPATVRRNMTAMGQLQKFALDQYDLAPVLRPRDLAKPADRPRERIPSEREFQALLSLASPAFRAALEALARSGIRPNELVRSRIEDLSPDRDLIVLQEHKTQGKTHKARRIALGESMQRLVAQAVGRRQTGRIWLTDRGRPWTEKRLSTRFAAARDRLGLDPELVLYSLRHMAGTRIAREHGIWAAKTVLGHERISTTQRYAHAQDDDARRWQG
jgi:site-specific recombinase XerD